MHRQFGSLVRMAKMLPLLLAVLLLAHSHQASAAPTTLHYSDGSPRWTYSMASGMPSGDSTMFYPDGSIMVKGTYKVGLKHGLFLYYAPDGTIKERSLFVHGQRRWRVDGSASSDKPPLELLQEKRDANIADANTGELVDGPLPFLPFAALVSTTFIANCPVAMPAISMRSLRCRARTPRGREYCPPPASGRNNTMRHRGFPYRLPAP